MAWDLTDLSVVDAELTLPARNFSGIKHNLDKEFSRPPDIEIAGHRERYRRDEQSCTIIYQVQWTARLEFVRWVLGYTYSRLSPGTGGATAEMLREIPHQHPEKPWLYAQKCELVEALGASVNSENSFAQDADGTPQLDAGNTQVLLPAFATADNQGRRHLDGTAKYAVEYKPLDYEVRTDTETRVLGFGEISRYVTRTFTYAIQSLGLGQLRPKWLPATFPFGAPGSIAGAVISEGGAMQLPTMQLRYLWQQVPDVPREVIAATVGKVNSQPFDGAPGSYLFPAESLLCQAPKTKRYRNQVGRVLWDIEYIFDYRRTGWNNFPARTGRFYRAGYSGSADAPVYATYDFRDLFKPGLPVNYG